MEHKTTSLSESSLWKAIWKCRIPGKVKHFAWRLAKGILPTNSALFYRKVLQSSFCPICSTHPEDINHCFFFCNWVESAWRIFGTVKPMSHDSVSTISAWLCDLMDRHPSSVLEDCLMFLWQIWRARNDQVFNSVSPIPGEICIKATRFLVGFRNANKKPVHSSRNVQRRWQPPTGDLLKMNCDGAFRNNGRAGIGAIVRDADKEVLGAMASPIQSCLTVKEIEARAIRDGLIFAKDCGFRNLLVESDACEIIEEVNRDTPSFSLHGNIIEDIKSLAMDFNFCSFAYVSRNLNMVADRLASVGVSASDSLYWVEEAPSCIADVLLLDT